MHAFFCAFEAVVVHAISDVGCGECLLNGNLKGLEAVGTSGSVVVRTESTIGEEVEVTAHDSTP